MKPKYLILSLIIFTAVLLAACSPQPPGGDTMLETDKNDEMMSDINMSDEDMSQDDVNSEGGEMEVQGSGAMIEDKIVEGDDITEGEDDNSMVESGDEMEAHVDDQMDTKDGDRIAKKEDMLSPDWFQTSIIEARTGEAFSVSDFKGKVVLVETLAMWCSNCLKQQKHVLALHEQIGERDDFVSLGIDIDPNENTAALKKYIETNGFNWNYTVAPVEVAREIGQLYGDQFLNPPSTPMLIIDRYGEVHLLPFGIKTADSLFESLQPFLNGGM